MADLDTAEEAVVCAELPHGFFISTPVGDHSPDWAVAFKEGTVKHIYFVAETKGSMSTMQLRKIEEIKIDCARKFLAELSAKADDSGSRHRSRTCTGCASSRGWSTRLRTRVRMLGAR